MTTLKQAYDQYIEDLEQTKITKNTSYKRDLAYNLCEYLGDTSLSKITYRSLKLWFKELSYFKQVKAKSALDGLFDELIAEGELKLKHNPFGKGTGKLAYKERPAKARQRLTMEEFVAIRNLAIADGCQWLVNAMDLSYLLKLRRADVVTLKFKEHDKDSKTLQKAILKSHNMNGAENGVTLKWDLTEPYGKDVSKIIAQARSTRLIDIKYKVECSPYVIHHRPQRIAGKPNKEKTHHTQVTEALLSRTFKKYRDSVQSIAERCEEDGSQPPTFHEIRSLSARNDSAKGMSKAEIGKALAHSVNTVTDLYLDEQVVEVTSLNTMADMV